MNMSKLVLQATSRAFQILCQHRFSALLQASFVTHKTISPTTLHLGDLVLLLKQEGKRIVLGQVVVTEVNLLQPTSARIEASKIEAN